MAIRVEITAESQPTESLGVELEEIRLVAAHGWDIAGALRAGCAAAFLNRIGKSAFPIRFQVRTQ